MSWSPSQAWITSPLGGRDRQATSAQATQETITNETALPHIFGAIVTDIKKRALVILSTRNAL